MTAWILLAVVVALGIAAIGVGCWRDRDPDPALAEHPCSDQQWSDLVVAMRSVRRRRRRERRAVRRA